MIPRAPASSGVRVVVGYDVSKIVVVDNNERIASSHDVILDCAATSPVYQHAIIGAVGSIVGSENRVIIGLERQSTYCEASEIRMRGRRTINRVIENQKRGNHVAFIIGVFDINLRSEIYSSIPIELVIVNFKIGDLSSAGPVCVNSVMVESVVCRIPVCVVMDVVSVNPDVGC